jgi:virginiamycin B lyase
VDARREFQDRAPFQDSKFQSRAIPGGGNIVRNTSATREGNFMLANTLVNGVTLVTIKK